MGFFDSENKSFHSDTDQLKRQKSALSLKMDSVDSDLKIGSIKNYSVSLENCSCADFARRHKPCKHMYRLAMDLGIFKVGEINLDNFVNEPKAQKKFENRHVNYEYVEWEEIPKNFVVIDFETANHRFDSICQLGLVVVENNTITEEKSFLIKPPYEKFSNSDIHGITFDDVKLAPTFDKLWPNIKDYIDNHTIAAYNLFFDWNCLNATLERYQIEQPKFQAFDILACVKHFYSEQYLTPKSYSLVNVAKAFELQHKAHDALSDAHVSAEIQILINNDSSAMQANVYIANISTILERIMKNNTHENQIAFYCQCLLDKENLSYEKYKNLFKVVEQIAGQNNSALLYKYCGSFYERFNKLPRAISLYKKSSELDSKMRLKAKIQKLEKIQNVRGAAQ